MIIYLCRDLERTVKGLDLGEIKKWFAKWHPEAELRISGEACDRPEDWLGARPEAGERFVFCVCSLNSPGAEFHARLRKRGADPCAAEVVDLGGMCAGPGPASEVTLRARLLIEAAVAKLHAYSGSRPENAKMLVAWNEEMSRRSLFTLPPVRYEIIPSLREELCASEEGCRICANLCPHKALSATEESGWMTLQKDKCTGCGACVSACPCGAFDFPGASLEQLQAQIGILLSEADLSNDRRGILFLCHNAATALRKDGASYPADWLPVQVPCLGMVSPSWILQCLSQGAAAVGMLPCQEDECRFGGRGEIEGRADYCQALIAKMGLPEEAVRLFRPGAPEDFTATPGRVATTNVNGVGEKPTAEPDLSPRGAGSAALALAARQDSPPELRLAHPHSPLGAVEVLEGCTVCGACAAACPAGALSLERGEADVALTFSASLCVGCAGCIEVCPENIMEIEKSTDLFALSQGERTLYRDTTPRCENCGEPVAPQAMLDRIGGILEDHPALSVLGKYCIECRKTMF